MNRGSYNYQRERNVILADRYCMDDHGRRLPTWITCSAAMCARLSRRIFRDGILKEQGVRRPGGRTTASAMMCIALNSSLR